MKKILLAFALVAVVLGGCKGKTGPAGASGANGTDNPSKTNVYTTRFQTGVEPSNSYSGITWDRLDLNSQETSFTNDGNLFTGISSTEDVSAILVKFNIAGLIPSNAILTTAAIELVSTSSTTLTGPVTVGVHSMGYAWNNQADWHGNGSGALWGPQGQMFGSYCYGSAMGTVVIPTFYTGATNRIGFDVSTATIAGWMNGTNNGLAIVSENMGADTSTGTVVFSTPTDSNVSYRPVLEVNYTL
jgi:hypothetical protein